MFDLISAFCTSTCDNCWGNESSSYDDQVNYLASRGLSKNSRDCVVESMQLRSVFLSVTPVAVPPVEGHTHGVSAASRSTASAMIDQLASSSGRTAVFYQGSASDVRKGRNVTRSWHWAKDQNVTPQTMEKSENDLLAMVDVDYYVDMPRLMTKSFVPIVLYTFQPSGVCKDKGEYKFTFDKDNVLHYHVSGGGEYRHEVWNYAGDSVGVKHKILGITVSYATYSVERKVLDPDHQLVLLAPLRKYRWWRAWWAVKFLGAVELERLKVVHGDFTRLKVNHADRMEMHTGKPGKYLSAVTLASVDDAIASAVVTSKIKLTLSSVKSKMGETARSENFRGAEVLLEYHLTGKSEPLMVNSLENAVRRYQWLEKVEDLDEDAKPAMVAFMEPLIDGAFVPDDTVNNDKRMVKKRVTELANIVEITPFVEKVMAEFVEEFTRWTKHSLHPVEVEEVYEHQARPTQQRILDAAENESPDRKVDMFGKREAGQKPGDPRGISTINGVDKREYSQFTYAVAEAIKHMKWYAFGKSPVDIAERVALLCQTAFTHVDSTDFSRMDGRVSNAARKLERMLMFALFHHHYHSQLEELLKSQHSLKGKTRNGVRYYTGLSRLSGSPETSLFNTVLSAFTAFLAYRMSKTSGRPFTSAEAWKKLGMYGGDDGLSVDLSRDIQERAARAVGQVMTLDRTRKYERGVVFLSRHYGPDVWMGDTTSCCDILRTLSKFHVTVSLPSNISKMRKLQEKCLALSFTDANTPVLGEMVRTVLRNHPLKAYGNVLNIWNSDLPLEDQYPNERREWMIDLFNEQIPSFDEFVFYDWLIRLDSGMADIALAPPIMAEPLPVVVKDGMISCEGDLHGAPEAVVPTVAKPKLVSKPKEMKRATSQTRTKNTRNKGESSARGRPAEKRKASQSAK